MAKAKRNAAPREMQPIDERLSVNISNDDLKKSLKIRRVNIQFRNESQKKFWELMSENEITLCAGPAGTGKSFLSVWKAIELFGEENSPYKQIIILTPAVESEEELGFLPGDVDEKMAPYIYSTVYLFSKILGEKKVNKLRERGLLQVVPLAYMRGLNIDNAIVIFEEAQNCTKGQMKTFLTRIGENTKYFISGDLMQCDRKRGKEENGLLFAIKKLSDIDGIGVFNNFKSSDIVRNKLIEPILERFEDV